MVVKGSATTAREISFVETLPSQLWLDWVWPIERSERLQGARIQLGRDDEAAIRLDGNGVSRKHAELYRQGPIYALRDLGSTNGTWLNGKRIEHAPALDGHVLRVGEWLGVFRLRPDRAVTPFGELFPGVFGGDALASALASLAPAAKSTLPISLVGDTGTGKERIAHAVHRLSGRSGPLVAINCAALPDHLAEAELFGYRRGAFTGADRASGGHFRAAHRGTLFLDEAPELSPALQAKLLRVLEDGKVMGLGESIPVEVDVRVISASQRPLAELVAENKLRRDLAARLEGITLHVPRLKERSVEVPWLFMQLLSQHSGGRIPSVETRLLEALCLHDWPQNVRELQLVARQLLTLHGQQPRLRRSHLPAHLAGLVDEALGDLPLGDEAGLRPAHDLAKVHGLLAQNRGNVSATAEHLGISRQRVYRLLERGRSDASNEHDERS
jgi:DNA-binding NtrC family response regulator